MLERDYDFNVQQSRVMCKLEEIIFWINAIIGFGINKWEKQPKQFGTMWITPRSFLYMIYDIHVKKKVWTTI